MAFVNDTVLAANSALNKMGALFAQAKSYSMNPQMLRARSIASSIANGAKLAATNRSTLIGVGAGAAAGAGYDYLSNNRSDMRSMAGAGLRGAAIGGLSGMGYYGMKRAGGAGAIMGSARSGLSSARSGLNSLGARTQSWWGNRVAQAQSAKGFGY